MSSRPTRPERLSADDAAILALESASIAGHTLKVLVTEPGDAPLDLARLRASVAGRLATQPRATERVDLSGGVPRWVADEHFDIANHVRRPSGASCADDDALCGVAGELMAERLDHSHPLWAFDVIGPFTDGREAIVVRIHHAMADGLTSVRFLTSVLWDVAPSVPGNDATAWPSAATSPPGQRLISELRHLPGVLRRELGGRGDASPFDRPIGASRAVAFVLASLAVLKAIGHSRPHRCTVNDVLLAIVAGGLREWLSSGRSALPRLRAQVPVSLHHRDDGAELGNRDSFLNVDLCLDDADPLDRLDRISVETAKRKQLGDAEELYDVFHALRRFVHIGHAAERLAGDPREFSVAISNVPGPPAPVTIAGRRVAQLYSAAEPAARHALRISAISCADDVGIGLCTDPGAVPGIGQLAAAIRRSYAELRSAAAA